MSKVIGNSSLYITHPSKRAELSLGSWGSRFGELFDIHRMDLQFTRQPDVSQVLHRVLKNTLVEIR